jgi:hypothetical protein
MSDGGLSFHRVGKELGAGRWEKGLSVEPRGLSLGNNILLLFQRTCAFYVLFYPKFLARGKRAKGMHADGTHAVPRVTSVNPGACK